MTATPIDFPALVFTDPSRKFAYAFSAADDRDLHVCPLHAYVRTGRLTNLRLFDSAGRCMSGQANGRWAIDRQIIRDVGPVTWAVAALISGLDVPLAFEIDWRKVEGLPLDRVRQELVSYICRNPSPHVRQRPLKAVLAGVNRADSFAELCRTV